MKANGDYVRTRNLNLNRKNKGQALVELALILPILLVFLFGIVEFGRIFSASLMVNHSAREAARIGSLGASDTEIVTQVNLTAPILDATRTVVVITPSGGSRTRGEELAVQVSYPVDIVTPFISVITGTIVTVQGQCTMRVE